MSEEKKIDLLDLVVILIKKKYLLLAVGFITAVLSYLSIYFFIDEEFESTAVVVPYDAGKGAAGMSSLLKNLSGLPIGGLASLGGGSSSLDLYLTIIYSRSTLTSVIDKFDMRKEYEEKYFSDVLKRMGEDIGVVNEDDLSLSVTVRNKNPEKAAQMANFIVDILNRKVYDINVKKAKDNRNFIEKRYNEVLLDLKTAEDKMLKFQQTNGVFEAEQQVKATIEALSNLEVELARKQVELETLEQAMGTNDVPAVKNLRASVDALKKKVDDIKAGRENSSVLISMGTLPAKAIDFFRHYRDVKVNSEMMEFLLPLYEQAKYDEQRDTPVILTIDKALPSDKKVYPPRMIYTILISVFAVGMVSFLLILEYLLKNTTDPKIKYLFRNIFSLKEKQV